MGLGKTLQCIGLIAYMIGMGVKGPFIVAAPLSTVPNWVAEFKRFTPTVREKGALLQIAVCICVYVWYMSALL